ncbi:MAG TPA: phosphonate C-P lyase system protein PhnL [Burkholderiales bacterium]|nr:phosphonate C-P lyase system protein PhnL [Burkholderiales bacterium]
MIEIEGLSKTFTLHNQHGAAIPVLAGVDLTVCAGECVVLVGESGAGKSTLMRMIYANYRAASGRIGVRHDGAWVDIAAAEPRLVLDVRRRTMGYVSQFLRVIPRVSALDIVAEPLRVLGLEPELARARARNLLERLHVPANLWDLPPATFSGGEQQRINIARSFAFDFPILLCDEPTAALDSVNRQIVVELIQEARTRGGAIVGIFHDPEVRDAVASRLFPVKRLAS